MPHTQKVFKKPVPEIILVQAYPKHPRMDYIIEKAVELGIQAIFPVITERSIVQPVQQEARQKQIRWQKKVKEAAKQSGALWFPEIFAPHPLNDILSIIKDQKSVIITGVLRKELPTLYEETLKIGDATPLPEKIYLMIGPEGDFTEKELEALSRAGSVFVQFGTPILRTDTAALFGLSVLASAFPRQFL
jgi:16S rRNA (uracil1498-N3)-methyltransferase